jgi:hypothetical protein
MSRIDVPPVALGWDGEFESGFLQGRVECERDLGTRRNPVNSLYIRPVFYRLRPIACQTVTTAIAHRIVTGAYAMLYRGMDRAQLDAAYNNSAAVSLSTGDWIGGRAGRR